MADTPRDPPIHQPPIRLAVCVSGEGRTLQNLIDRIASRALRATIVQVVASRPRIGAIARAEAAGIPQALAAQGKPGLGEFSASVFAPIRQRGADLVILGGFLSLLEIPRDYNHRVINVHPALLPSFGGRGLHGRKAHEAVLAAGVKVSGCTVHFANDQYDAGPIIAQHAVPVLETDDPDTLAERVFQAECQTLPAAIALYADGRLRIDGKRVHILP